MSAASNYVEKGVLNCLLRGVPLAASTKTVVALFTGDPGEDGKNNEVATAVWPAYVRRDAAVGEAVASAWTEPNDDGRCLNTKQLIFPSNNGAGNVTVSHWGLFDQDGRYLTGGALVTPRTLMPGDVFVFDANQLEVVLA